MNKKVFLLGATGSVGKSALIALKQLKITLSGFSFNKNIDRAFEIIEEFKPEYVLVYDNDNALRIKKKYQELKIIKGENELENFIQANSVQTFINALAGISGLIPSYLVLKNNKTLITANKESIVIGSKLLLSEKKRENQVIPIDSEHWSIFLLLDSIKKEKVDEIIITGSGGPFLNLDKNEFENIKLEDALNHPIWNMGKMITISSSTLANKGLEVLEAKELFGLSLDKIKIILHPQAKVHGMVRLIDGSIISHCSKTSMVDPIRNALTYPKIKPDGKLSLENEKFEFFPVNFDKFPMVRLAYLAGKNGQFSQMIYTIANDVASKLFLEKKISYIKIAQGIEKALEKIKPFKINNISEIIEIERELREKSKKIILE